MRRVSLQSGIAAAMFAIGTAALLAQAGPYKVIKTAKVGGAGTFDYVYADAVGRKLYIPRTGPGARITVFDLDTLAPAGEIPDTSARGAAVDPKSGHGFVSSKPVVMFDTKTLAVIKKIDVQGQPDGIMFDAFNGHVHIFSHSAPNDTVINAADGTVVTTIDLGGAPEQAQGDGAGHLYVDLEDKDAIAVVDTKTNKVTATYDLTSQGGAPAGLGLDSKNHILFAACAEGGKSGSTPHMVILTTEGKILAGLPIGASTDGGGFNPNTMEAFSSNRDGTLTVIKENSPTSFVVEQNVPTKTGAKTMTIDTKTNQILLITADYAAPAASATPPPAGGRGPRPTMVADSFQILVVGK
jgi:DNA-binding beta-propeller fold protein YncE